MTDRVSQTAQPSAGLGGILPCIMTTVPIRHEFAPPSPPDSPSAADWRRVTTNRHNVLLEGSAAGIDSVLGLLAQLLPEPVSWQRGSPLALPIGECGALVVENVAALNDEDQARLRMWLDNPTRRPQIVSTAAYPLFPLVDCHLFDAALYYRLSAVRFVIS
jgi:hypothetical protein